MSFLDDYYELYCPAIVPETENESEEEFDARWQKFDLLDEDNKNKLSSFSVAKIIFNISQKYNLLPQNAAYISRSIRKYYFKELLEEEIAAYLAGKINLSTESVKDITDRIFKEVVNPIILDDDIAKEDREISSKKDVEIEKLAISDILDKYPNIMEQLLSTDQIKIEKSIDPVRPSIKNWIADYHDKNGVGKHSPIDRGNYLFHSENGKKLSPAERQKVGMILKSLDEQTPLNIDPERQVVIFGDEHGNTRSESKTWIPDQVRNDNVGALDSRFRGNDNVGRVTGMANGEPRDIFDLKIKTTGKSLNKIPAAQNNNANMNVGRMDMVSPAPAPTPVPVSLPTEKSLPSINAASNIEQETKESDLASRLGSSEFIQPSSVSNGPEQEDAFKVEAKMEIKNEEKPKVELKNISFSPNFVAQPKENDRFKSEIIKKTTLPAHVPAEPALKAEIPRKQEQIFSIPGSKPPLGTEHYDVDKHQAEERIAAIAAKVPAALPIQEALAPNLDTSNQSGATRISEIPIASSNAQDLDSLSDDMLLQLYRQKAKENKSINPIAAKPKGFHIGPMHSGNENIKAKPKNVVDLKN